MTKLSVVVGRFQINNLHKGHLELLREAQIRGDQVLILLGITDATGTDKDPLDFKTREKMFYSCGLSSPIIRPVYDRPCDKDWSKQVDAIIEELGFENALIFGGRDNSIRGYYSGKHPIHIVDQQGDYSATSIRNKLANEPLECSNFRAGIIYHTQNRYPIVYSTVDIILWRHGAMGFQVLVGKKGDKFAFIGGFVDPSDYNIYEAARRELFEETGINKEILCYFDSFKVSDHRYKNTKDSIMTHVFQGTHNRLPDLSKIQDREFLEFRFIGEDDLDLMQDCHKPIFTNFFNFIIK